MNHAHPHEHGHGAALALPFSAVEWGDFRAQDKRAATVIAGLMTGIFGTGLLMYLFVAWVVGS